MSLNDAAARPEPTDAANFCRRAEAHLKEGRYDEALADATEALQRAPQDAHAYQCRGHAHQRLKQHEAAIADYSAALELDPERADLYADRGDARTWLEDFAGARADYTAALRLRADNADVLRNRGVAHHHDGDYDSARADYSAALRLNPHDARAYRFRGQARLAQDDPAGALADLSEAIRLDPALADAFQDRGQLWSAEGEFQQAVADFTEAIRLNPNDDAAHRGRGAALDELGEYAKADADFDTAAQLLSEETTMRERHPPILTLLEGQFDPTPLDGLAITERQFPYRVRADLQRGIDSLLETVRVLHFCGVRKQYAREGVNFTELLVRDRNNPAIAVPPQYEEIDIGEDRPVRCLMTGLWLLEDGGTRFALFLEPIAPNARWDGIRLQVAADSAAGARVAQQVFTHFEEAVRQARSYRGKVLSLEWEQSYSGAASGIKVHRLRRVARDQVILPRTTLELLERNVIQFVRQRARLAEWGLATKKGLLFYGPPGTGKTHTIHYLAAELPGTTTLLISAEQVGLLGEYMTLARLLQPSLVVIEDADLIARDRAHMDSACEEVLLNKLLNEMDGLKEDADILFVLTTNRPEALEAALTARPGRIDQAIEFPFPDAEGRQKLLRLYARGMPVADETVQATVRKTEGVSAAFIKELMRRAAQFRLERGGDDGVRGEDVDNALQELLFRGGSLNRKLLGGGVAEG